MAPITANILAALQLLVGFGVILVGLGFWGGKIEGRRTGRNPMSTSPSEATGSNGTPSVGELSRRVKDLQDEFRDDRRNYIPRQEADAHRDANKREHEDLWGAIKDLRTIDSATARRIDGLMGSGS